MQERTSNEDVDRWLDDFDKSYQSLRQQARVARDALRHEAILGDRRRASSRARPLIEKMQALEALMKVEAQIQPATSAQRAAAAGGS